MQPLALRISIRSITSARWHRRTEATSYRKALKQFIQACPVKRCKLDLKNELTVLKTCGSFIIRSLFLILSRTTGITSMTFSTSNGFPLLLSLLSIGKASLIEERKAKKAATIQNFDSIFIFLQERSKKKKQEIMMMKNVRMTSRYKKLSCNFIKKKLITLMKLLARKYFPVTPLQLSDAPLLFFFIYFSFRLYITGDEGFKQSNNVLTTSILYQCANKHEKGIKKIQAI